MKTSTSLLLLTLSIAGITCANAAVVSKTIDSAQFVNGYMNVYDLPSNGGAYVFGSGWGVSDLNTTFPSSSQVIFTPNTIGDPASFWYTPSGGPGSSGNKIMEANLYVQPADGTLSGQTINFEGSVEQFSLVDSYTFRAFILDFSPDYSSVIETYTNITHTGNFSVSYTTVNDPTRHVQWGLQMKGPCVWITDVASKGSVTVSAVPEASTCIMLGLAITGMLVPRARRRN
jgi:hypothetical protein